MNKKIKIIIDDQLIETGSAFIIADVNSKIKTILSAEDLHFLEKVLGTAIVNILAFVNNLAGKKVQDKLWMLHNAY